MKKIISALLLALFLVGNAAAAKFTVKVVNELYQSEDPICLKAINFSLGQIKEISHQVDEPIGKEFNATFNLPHITQDIEEYKTLLSEQGKELDNFVFGNSERILSFKVFYSNCYVLSITENDFQTNLLPSNKGITIQDILYY